MAQYVFSMNRVGKTVPPKRQILKNISLSFFPGAKIGVLGVNGSGKSTLLKIMAGLDKEIEGEAIPMPGIRIGYLPQEPALDPTHTVRQSVESGMGEVMAAKERLDAVYAAYAEEDADFDALAAEQAELEAIIAAAGTDSEHQLEIAADALRLPPWDESIEHLSGGEKRRIALCRLLLSKPDMLLLDEPTNHLDAESVEWLEQYLARFPGTVVAITHDRYFLDNAAEWILELDRGHGIPYKGNYSSWLEQKDARLALEQRTEDARAKAMGAERVGHGERGVAGGARDLRPMRRKQQVGMLGRPCVAHHFCDQRHQSGVTAKGPQAGEVGFARRSKTAGQFAAREPALCHKERVDERIVQRRKCRFKAADFGEGGAADRPAGQACRDPVCEDAQGVFLGFWVCGAAMGNKESVLGHVGEIGVGVGAARWAAASGQSCVKSEKSSDAPKLSAGALR